MDLKLRLDILKESNQINEKIYSKILTVIDLLKIKRNIILTEENGAMFITHLASALGRIEHNKVIDDVDKEILEEIKKNHKYEEVFDIVQDIENITGKLGQAEKNYIAMHICTLLNS